MRWQKILRWAIAAFVLAYAGWLVVSLRRPHQRAAGPAPIKTLDPKAAVQTTGKGEFTTIRNGKPDFSIQFGNQVYYEDGRSRFGGGIRVSIPDRNGRSVLIEAQEADVVQPPGQPLKTGIFKGGTKMTTSDGVTVQAATASYDGATHTTTIPGPLTFSKERMTGSGVGGSYDQDRAVLWILKDAKIDVAPDEKGSGAMHVTSTQAGMARQEHYMKFIGSAHLDGEGHLMDADEATTYLTQDDKRATRMELRSNSRITSKPGTSGPQEMRAKDIDIAYAADGRTLQSAHLVENAAVRLPGDPGKPGKQIAAKNIDVGLAPDGETVTNLNATENVVVDLPADGETPARKIRSTILIATGAPPAGGQPGGIRNATFGGGVDFREHRDAKGKLTAIERTAKSDKLEIQTKPGFGDLERADFHSNVRFTDGATTTADAPTALYDIARDRLDLSPGTGDGGKGPHVTDGRMSTDAAHIQMALSAQKIKADTNVRSVVIQQQGKSNDDTVKVPSMLKPDRPVYVKSNRLDYDSASSLATYEGGGRLWQDGDDGSTILADTIVLDDRTGNLHAIGSVVTTTFMKSAGQPDAKPSSKDDKQTPTITKAEEMVYVDDKHLATYTRGVHMNGPDRDLTSEKLDLYFAEEGGDLERAEAEGTVVLKQINRRSFGRHLSYAAKDELYTMIGVPALVYDDAAPNCKLTKAPTVQFRGDQSTGSATGNGTFGQKSEKVACGTGPDKPPNNPDLNDE
jgi:lipopolysaccharide export system protein LptA